MKLALTWARGVTKLSDVAEPQSPTGSDPQLDMEMNRSTGAVLYKLPSDWIRYDRTKVVEALVAARSAVLALREIPYRRAWVEKLQAMQLKREVAGTSRIEGADFTDLELEAALKETPEQLQTRSQKQAHAAVNAYRWITSLPDDQPISGEIICHIHRIAVAGADDDHCEPGVLRGPDQNVTFGAPRHRGAEGGQECRLAFDRLAQAIQTEFRGHDPLIQALAAHYHFAAMHPFLDGNGRTARVLEAVFLQRAGLRDTCFIAMSNYYYDEKNAYLTALAAVRRESHDLTEFLIFGLNGVAIQSRRLLGEIRRHVAEELFRNLMYDLFGKLKTPRKRVIADRQLEALKILLAGSVDLLQMEQKLTAHYERLQNPRKALIRDLNSLIQLGAIHAVKLKDGNYQLTVNLDWPTQITETEFFEQLKKLPKAKTYPFLQYLPG